MEGQWMDYCSSKSSICYLYRDGVSTGWLPFVADEQQEGTMALTLTNGDGEVTAISSGAGKVVIVDGGGGEVAFVNGGGRGYSDDERSDHGISCDGENEATSSCNERFRAHFHGYKKETKFTSKCTANEIIKKIEQAAKSLGFDVHKKNYKHFTIPEILVDEWFKKDYKPTRFYEKEDTSLDDVEAVFKDSEGYKKETKFTSKCTANEIIKKIEQAAKPLGFDVHKKNYKEMLTTIPET
ncbi:hypothetical protein ACS0TY_005989 [Phlomoides rotata]